MAGKTQTKMIPQILFKLVKNKKFVLGFVVGLAFIMLLVYHYSQISVYKTQLDSLQKENRELQAALDEQTAQVERWKKEGEIQRAKIEEAKAKLIDIEIKYNKLQQDILKMQPPKTCTGAMEWLKNIAPALSK